MLLYVWFLVCGFGFWFGLVDRWLLVILVYGCGWVAGVAFACVIVYFLSLCLG